LAARHEENNPMQKHFLASTATACVILTSGLAYAQSAAEPKRDEPKQQSDSVESGGSLKQEQNRARGSRAENSTQAQLPKDKEIRISETMKRQELAPPEQHLNLSVSVGTEVPERVRLHRLAPEIVSIAPEYSDYDYFTTDDDIVIVDPRSRRIVSEIPREVPRARAEVEGGTTTTANLDGNAAAPCEIMRRDSSGQLSDASSTTIGSSARSHGPIVVTVQTSDQRSTPPIPLDAPAGRIIIATQGPGDCRVTIEPEPTR
jgi:hypothetical protein